MTLDPQFSLINSEFNRFLYAPIGDDKNGVEVTVLSGLTRLGLDPWGEAARLARLPRGAAVSTLDAMLAQLPEAGCDIAETTTVAVRLVQLLPDAKAAPAPLSPKRAIPAKAVHGAAALILLIIMAALAFLAH
jgi:hypothetical protein